MITETAGLAGIKIKTGHDVQATGDPDVAVDRYLIDGADSGGLIAVVEHELAPRVLAAPVHRHSREDEYTLVLEGRLGIFSDGAEGFAGPGELVFKPRDHWHTFWNAGDERLRVLELIAPGGLEELFRKLGEPGGEYDPETLPILAAQYGCEVDFERTMPLVQRYGLVF